MITSFSSFIFAILMFIGGIGYSFDKVKLTKDLSQIIYNILFIIINYAIFFIFTFLFAFIINFNISSRIFKNYNSKKGIFLVFIILLAVYGLVYYAFFPGILGYDVYSQIPQALGNEPLSAHHPVLHTLFIRFFLKMGLLFKYEGAGVVIYSILQLLLFTFGITYLIFLINKEKVSMCSLIFSTIWFACYPVFVLFSFNMTKDTI